MTKAALTHMLEDFENTARDVITSRGARVVKTIGDAVMYISDDLLIAADVVTALVDELQKGPDAIRVRASLVEGAGHLPLRGRLRSDRQPGLTARGRGRARRHPPG